METKELEQEYRDYEISFLGLTETISQTVADVLIKLNMEILSNSSVRKMTLSYPIKKHLTGFFGYLQFRTLPEKIIDLKNQIASLSDVLRFLVITPPIKKVTERVRSAFSEKQSSSSRPDKDRDSERGEREFKPAPEILSNKLLEQKLEEILN